MTRQLADYIGTRWRSKAGLEYRVTHSWMCCESFVSVLRAGKRGHGRSINLETLLRNYTRLSPPVSDETKGGST